MRQNELQRTNAENLNQIFPEKELRGRSPNYAHSLWAICIYIPTIDRPILLQEICGPILGIQIAHRHMNVETGAEIAQFPEKEYINGIVRHCLEWNFLSNPRRIHSEKEDEEKEK